MGVGSKRSTVLFGKRCGHGPQRLYNERLPREKNHRKVDRIWELRRDVSVYPHTEVGLPRGILFERRS